MSPPRKERKHEGLLRARTQSSNSEARDLSHRIQVQSPVHEEIVPIHEEEAEEFRCEMKPFARLPPPYAAPIRSRSPLPEILPSRDITLDGYYTALANSPQLFAQNAFALRDDFLVKKTALGEIEMIPEMWTGRRQSANYHIVGCNVYRRTGVLVTPQKITTFFRRTRDLLRLKLKRSIIDFHHSPTQTEAYLWKWSMYKYIRFFRPSMDKAEQLIRAKVVNEPIYIDDNDEDMPLETNLHELIALEAMDEAENGGLGGEIDVGRDDSQYQVKNGVTAMIAENGVLVQMLMQAQQAQQDANNFDLTRYGVPMAPGHFRAGTSSPPSDAQSHAASISPGQHTSPTTHTAPTVTQPFIQPPPTQPQNQRQFAPEEELADLHQLVSQAQRAARDMTREQVKALRASLYEVVFAAELYGFDNPGDIYAMLAEKYKHTRRT